jgi:hypothetical protein
MLLYLENPKDSTKKLALVGHACNPSYSGGPQFKDNGLIVLEILSCKYPKHKKRAGRVSQVVELFLSKYEALNSNPSTIINKNKRFFQKIFRNDKKKSTK